MPAHIHTADQLSSWLQQHHINLALWGQGNHKTPQELWREIERGETRLVDHPPRRVVESVMILVWRNQLLLQEVEQTLGDGRVRHRLWPPSEKFQRGETVITAALRGLSEEFSLIPRQIHLLPHTYRLLAETKDSYSYPGLSAEYQFHIIEAHIPDLPAGRFRTTEIVRKPGQQPKEHVWDWLKPGPALTPYLNRSL